MCVEYTLPKNSLYKTAEVRGRERRWRIINEVLDAEAQKSKKRDKSSMASSSVSWNQLSTAFPLKEVVFPRRDIPDDELLELYKYLQKVHKLYGIVWSGAEAKRLQFISPVINYVCALLPDVEISVEEDMRGVNVHANGRFEYVIKYRDRKICIVEAKKEDFEQGLIQCLLGCEVLADTESFPVVYGIVTNYVQWNFYECGSEMVRNEAIVLYTASREEVAHAEIATLKDLTAIIYEMLTSVSNFKLST